MRLAVLFDNLGPYHVARLTAVAARCDLLAIERHAAGGDYAWDSIAKVPFRRQTLFQNSLSAPGETTRAVSSALSNFRPSVIAVPGWATELAASAVAWAVGENVPVIVMSDSQAIDFRRTVLREWIKRRYIGYCAGALVAGRPHRDYLIELGMREPHIRMGYDVVDNEYFGVQAKEVRARADAVRAQYALPDLYLLTSARFIEKKNLEMLVEAFAQFLAMLKSEKGQCAPWHLVILGDGALREALENQVANLGLQGRVLLPGFKQYGELPAYYALAEAFILASITEQWGLVVNEAMASGLPVLVSTRCGCARDLVQPEVNGYYFDPENPSAIAAQMLRIAEIDERRRDMGEASKARIGEWSPELFGRNLLELAQIVLRSPKQEPGWLSRWILRMYLNRMQAKS